MLSSSGDAKLLCTRSHSNRSAAVTSLGGGATTCDECPEGLQCLAMNASTGEVHATLEFDASFLTLQTGESLALHLQLISRAGHAVHIEAPHVLVDLTSPPKGFVYDGVGCAADRDQSTCDDERSKDADAVLPTDTFRAWWGCV